jgi:phospholipase C
VTLGDALIASIYAALTASPQWPNTLFVLSFDENGGFYDHVSPPTTVDSYPGFQQLGFRVPAIIIGPMVKQGTIHTTFEHVSVISTLTERFGLSPINSRVTATNGLSSCIDPNKILTPGALTVRPPRLDPVRISMNAFAERMRRGPLVRNQPELQDLCDSGMLPKWVDRRADDQIVRRVLEAGQRLGAVKLVA